MGKSEAETKQQIGGDASAPNTEPPTSEPPTNEPIVELTPLATTIQDVFVSSYGSDCDPLVDLRSDSAETAVAASVEKLRGDGKSGQRYQLKGEIGRGGMGAVLRIFDSDLRRHLAMKVVLGRGGQTGGSAATIEPSKVLRFLEEAQVTGQLDHPGVVPVHELGVDANGRVYFTMRLVRGEDLARVFERVHAGEPDWSFTRALGVLLKVCEAMSYAHEKGVVHRDLKPQNIMVGQHGAVYVMDWGLARVEGRADTHDVRPQAEPEALASVRTDRRDSEEEGLDSPLLTMDGAVMGSPCYMPPEQAAGRLAEIGPHSDVYALGAMLYNLLTGRLPYQTPVSPASQRVILARVLAGSPRPVQELAPDVPPELVAICEKAMARNLRERYANMGELAEDLRAYLENRVVHAHRTGAVVELQKWIQRNKALAATLLAFVVVSVGGSTTAAIVLGAKNEVIRIARDDAVEESNRADAARLASERVTDFLASRFRTLEPEATRGRPVQVREFLDDAARSLEGELAGSPLEAAKLREVLGEAYTSLGLFDQAEPLLTQAFADRGRILGPDHPDTLGSMTDLAVVIGRQGRYEEAEELATRALEKSSALLGENHPETLLALNAMGMIKQGQGLYQESERIVTGLLTKTRAVFGRDSAAALTSLSNLALLYLNQGRYEEAEPHFEQALREARLRFGEDHPLTLAAIKNLASLYKIQGRYTEAAPLYAEALKKSEVVLGEDHPATLDTVNDLATSYLSQARYEEAEPLCLRAFEKRRDVLGADHPLTLISMSNLAGLYERQGRLEKAELLLTEALDRRLSVLGENHPDTFITMNNLASLYQSQDRNVEAEELYLETLAKRLDVLGPDHSTTLTTQNNLATLYLSLERYDEAEPLYTEALERWGAVLGEDHPQMIVLTNGLAVVYQGQGRYEDAERRYEEAVQMSLAILGEGHPGLRSALLNLRQLYDEWLALQRRQLGPDDPTTLETQRKLGVFLARWSTSVQTEGLLVECLDKRMAVLGAEHPATLESFHDLASYYAKQGRIDEAEGLFSECLDLRVELLGEEHPTTLMTLEDLTRLYIGARRWSDAESCARRLMELTPETSEERAARMLLLEQAKAKRDD